MNAGDSIPNSLSCQTENSTSAATETHYTTTTSGLVSVSASIPCPICSREKYGCSVRADGRMVLCKTVESKRQARDGTWIHWIDDPEQSAAIARAAEQSSGSTGKRKGPADKPAAFARLRFRGNEPKRKELADLLGVSLHSLTRLYVGWRPVGSGEDEWTAPELNGWREAVGVHLRKRDGFKYQLDGGQRGLVYDPVTVLKSSGPVLIVEGLSDTAAGLTMGLDVIGRPSNVGGVDDLAVMLERLPDDRLIILVGEDDRLKDGKPRELPPGHKSDCPGCASCWPGRFGAMNTATQLADLLGRPVAWAMPPGGAKDTRAWWKSQPGGTDPAEAGQRYLAGLLRSVEVIEPRPVESIPVVPIAEDDRPVVDLADYRQELGDRRVQAWAAKAGVYLDRSATGLGKSFADNQLAKQVHADGGQVLLSLPTHGQGLEVVAALKNEGVPAVKYPKRNTDPQSDHPVNCKNSQADLAEKLGLPVMQTACVGCRFNKANDGTLGKGWCSDRELNEGYISQVITASESPVVVATHARGAAQNLTQLGQGRDFIAIHEDPRPLLRPIDFLELDKLDSQIVVLRGMFSDEDEGNFRYGEELNRLGENENKSAIYDFLKAAVDRLDQVRELLVDAEEITPVLPVGPMPEGTANFLWWSMRRQKRRASGWRAVLAILGGEAEGWVTVNEKFDTMGRKVLVRKVQAVWQNPVPENAVVIIGDATSDTEVLGQLIGRPVTDITPGGRVPVVHRACQVPKDITKKTSGGTVKKILHGLVEQRPDLKRIGVICHREHIGAVQDVREESGRIARESYYGSGEDRASNSWHRDCDAMLLLGTPRPGGEAVRAELVRQGKLAAAAKSEPGWSKYEWRGRDERGNPVLVKSLRYADPTWQAAFESLCRSNLVQAIGRARAALPDGVEVIVISTEECGLPVRDGENPWLADGPAEVLAFVRETWSRNRPVFLQGNHVGKLADSQTGRLIKAGVIAKELAMPAKTVNNHLRVLDRLGLIIRDGKRGCRPVNHGSPEVQTACSGTVETGKPASQDASYCENSAADDEPVESRTDASESVLGPRLGSGLCSRPKVSRRDIQFAGHSLGSRPPPLSVKPLICKDLRSPVYLNDSGLSGSS